MTRTIVRISVDSTSLASVGYLHDQGILEAEFRNGETYRFFLVPPAVWDELLIAQSKGGFFNTRIKDRFPFVPVLEDPPDNLMDDLERSLAALRNRDGAVEPGLK